MDYDFQGAKIYEGDRLFVVGQGPAVVIETTAKYFRVRISGRTRKVSYAGVISGDVLPTVFWQDPVIAIPAKGAELWREQRALAIDTVSAFTRAVKDKELASFSEPPVTQAQNTASTASNDDALQDLVTRIQNGESVAGVSEVQTSGDPVSAAPTG